MICFTKQKKINTKWGTAYLLKNGYYYVHSKKEYLHRLIFEDFYGVIPDRYVVHHKNKEKSDCCILNLQLISKSEHHSIHNSGKNNVWYGKKLSKSHKSKMSESHKGIKLSKNHCRRISEGRKGIVFSEQHKKNISLSKQGSKHHLWKDFARITKNGFNGCGNQVYALRYNGKILQTSTNYDALFEKAEEINKKIKENK